MRVFLCYLSKQGCFFSFFSPLLARQLHDYFDSCLSPLNGAGLDLLRFHDREKHRVGERNETEGGLEEQRRHQRGDLVHVVFGQLPHDDREHVSPDGSHYGKGAGEARLLLLLNASASVYSALLSRDPGVSKKQ